MSTQQQGLLLDDLPTDLPPCPAPCASRTRPSFWQTHYQSPFEHHNQDAELPSGRIVDVVIIGSGITGCSVAARLVDRWRSTITRAAERSNTGIGSQSEYKVVVLEAREFCSGATARNGGHLTALPRMQYKDLKDMYGSLEAKRQVWLEDRACALVLDAVERQRCDCDLVQGGNLHLFEDEAEAAHVRAQIDAAKEDGVDVSMLHWLDKDAIDKEVGATAHAALRMPGNNLYPLKYVSSMFQHALDRCCQNDRVSLDLYTHTPIHRVKAATAPAEQPADRRARWVVETLKGPILARTVIHATNGYASSVIPSLATGPTRIVPTRGQVIAYNATRSSNPRWTTAFASPGGREYFFQRPHGGPIILGGARYTAGPPYEFGQSDDGVIHPVIESELVDYLPKQFPRWFAGPDTVGRNEQCWTGIMGYREGGIPMVGQLYDGTQVLEGQFISAGYSGHGMARAPACAQVVADMALAELDDEMYQVPEWFPRHFLSGPVAGGQHAEVRRNEDSTWSSGWWCTVS